MLVSEPIFTDYFHHNIWSIDGPHEEVALCMPIPGLSEVVRHGTICFWLCNIYICFSGQYGRVKSRNAGGLILQPKLFSTCRYSCKNCFVWHQKGHFFDHHHSSVRLNTHHSHSWICALWIIPKEPRGSQSFWPSKDHQLPVTGQNILGFEEASPHVSWQPVIRLRLSLCRIVTSILHTILKRVPYAISIPFIIVTYERKSEFLLAQAIVFTSTCNLFLLSSMFSYVLCVA